MKTEPINDYHAHDALSHSKLEVFRQREILYFKRYVAKTLPAPESTKAFAFGSAAHAAVLEPELFATKFAAAPKIDRRTKEGKAEAERMDLRSQAEGVTFLEPETHSTVERVRDAVHEHPLAASLLASGKPELVWRTAGKLPMQCRTDWFNIEGCELSNGRPYVADLKTVESLTPGAFGSFERSVFNFGYHRQAGFYLPLITEILNTPVFDFFFVAVEKVEPFGVAVYRLADDAVARGQDENIAEIRRLKRCIETNTWGNIPSQVYDVALPGWYDGGAK